MGKAQYRALLMALLEQQTQARHRQARKPKGGFTHIIGIVVVVLAFVGALWASNVLELSDTSAAPVNVRGNVGVPAKPSTGGLARIVPAPQAAPASGDVQVSAPVDNAPVVSAPVAPNVRALVEQSHPVVDPVQAEQLNAAAELAAQEASGQYTAQRQDEYAAAPVVKDRAQVEAEYGRDPCSAPRADPNTCKRGIVAATPLNTP